VYICTMQNGKQHNNYMVYIMTFETEIENQFKTEMKLLKGRVSKESGKYLRIDF
jgi:hypothetical protein